jgi:hypothetical protein
MTKHVFKLTLAIVAAIVILGFVLPAMVSARDDILVAVAGIFIIAMGVVCVILLKNNVNKIMKYGKGE